MIHMMVELFEIKRFLPLPYEEAMAPRLKRAQDKLWSGGGRPDWVRLPEERMAPLRLRALAESVRAQGRTLVVVDGGGLREGIRGAAAFAGVPADREGARVRLLSGLPGPEELRDAVELAANGSVALCAAGGRESPAFRLLRQTLEERYGEEAERYVLTAGDLGAEPGENSGFGLLTAAGLLPMEALGVDAAAVLRGAAEMRRRCRASSFENPAWRYAAVRRQLCRSGFAVELLCCWDSALGPLLEWAAQLFAAAEGKEGRVLFPVAVDYSRSFHTLGQCVQDGPRLFLETVVRLDEESEDGLAGLREAVMDGTMRAHTERGVPNLMLRPGARTAETLGSLLYFFQYAGGLSACLLDADPLSCPGVEACRARIRSLLPPEVPETKRRMAAAGIL